mgnify:CR=1 FL=1
MSDLEIEFVADPEASSDDELDGIIRMGNYVRCESQRLCVESGNQAKKLMVMCVGLKSKDGKRVLADFDGDDEIYNSLPDKSHWNFTVPFLKAEVKRRAKLCGLTVKVSTMSRVAALKFLNENPISNMLDEDWLQREEAKMYDTACAFLDDQARLAAARLRNANWNSHKPWLRFCLAMCHDKAREALAIRHRVKDRAELDASDSEERPDTCEQVVAWVHDNELIVLTTEAIPELHDLFAEPIELRFEDMPGGKISVEDVKG